MTALLILRPEPGASESAARARAMGLAPVLAPLFTVSPIFWETPDPLDFDAVLMTSANAARHAGAGLSAFFPLPCYAVGEATAAAARQAGFGHIETGERDGAAVLALMAARGARRVLHLCGFDRMPIEQPGVSVTRRTVYVSQAISALPSAALHALRDKAFILLHSPRAATLLAQMVDQAGLDRTSMVLIAISAATSVAAGGGWGAKHIAAEPRDQALLELAAKLCKTEVMSGTGSAR